MKFRELHKKIFIASIVILILSEIVVFLVFRAIAIRSIYNAGHDYVSYRAIEFKSLMEEKISKKSLQELKTDESLKTFFKDLNRQYRAKMLLMAPDGSIIQCAEPIKNIKPISELTSFKNFYYDYLNDDNLDIFYMHLPLSFPEDRTGAIIALFDTHNTRIVGAAEDLILKLFFYYLLGIGIGLTILLYPSSILITRPLRKLNRSAQKIAQGDLSHRANIDKKDEIGDLAQSFNQMAYTIEGMLKSTKQLTANISHELRSPLARIQIARDIIKEKLEKTQAADVLEEVDDIELEVKLMNRLIGQILLLSKLDGEGIASPKEQLDIVQTTQEIIQRFERAIENKSIDLKINPLPDPLIINANAEDVRVVISNLLDNAVKYSPENGDIELNISKPLNNIELSITNDCPPIPAKNLEKLFKPFYRPYEHDDSGSGLGLTITKKIIEKYSGRINVLQNENCIIFRVVFKAF